MSPAPRSVGSASNPSRSLFYCAMGLLALSVVLIGFFGTYLRPMVNGAFHAPLIVHLHGALAMGWVLVFALQPWFIRRHVFAVHRAVGVLGILLAVGAALTMVPAQFYASTRDAAAGGGNLARSQVLGTLSSALQVLGLVLAGALFVRHPTIHKRLMLLATIVLIWPAWFRWRHFLPGVPNPDLWLGVVAADSLIVIAWLRDRFTRGHIQPVLLNVGLLLMLEHLVEVHAFTDPRWVAAGLRLYRWLEPMLAPLITP